MPSSLLPRSFDKEIVRRVHCQYLLALPKGTNKRKRWPLVIFLHGAGERGDNLEAVTVHGPPKLVKAGRSFPFILVCPQCPLDSWWSIETLETLLNEILESHSVDRNRVYLTGLSMGGFGTWSWAIEHPDRFAAIAPICGGGRPLLVGRIKHIPVWAFHGAMDTVVSLSDSQRMVEALKKCGGKAKLTVYPKAGHDSWTKTYDNPAFYKWLLSQRRGKETAAKARKPAGPATSRKRR